MRYHQILTISLFRKLRLLYLLVFQVQGEDSREGVHVAVATEVTGVTPEALDDQTLTNNKRHNITLTTFTMAYSETGVVCN